MGVVVHGVTRDLDPHRFWSKCRCKAIDNAIAKIRDAALQNGAKFNHSTHLPEVVNGYDYEQIHTNPISVH